MSQSSTDHIHTSTPPFDSPWCEVCNALLTQAIEHEEASELSSSEDDDERSTA